MPSRRGWQAVHALGALLFGFFAVLQLNDPDAPLWVTLYAFPAFLCGWGARAHPPPWTAVATVSLGYPAAAALMLEKAWGRTSWAEMTQDWEMAPGASPAAEVAREAGGLFIVSAWMLVLLWDVYRLPWRWPRPRAPVAPLR